MTSHDLTPDPYQAAVLADSVAPDGTRLTTFIVTFPRFVLAEFNTHRVFSRNSASSRAIPVKTRIEMIKKDPFIPLKFGKNKSGMQSTEDLDGDAAEEARRIWLKACMEAVANAQKLSDLKVHKQFANRILEPYAWHTVIVTATEWENYWSLRISENAQPEIALASESMKKAMEDSTPVKLDAGEWHLPLIFEEDVEESCVRFSNLSERDEFLAKISCARCARVSYLTHDGIRSIDADLTLFERLTSAGHMSPLEHAAVVGEAVYVDFGHSTRELQETRHRIHTDSQHFFFAQTGAFIGNFRAPWIQYRKLILGEDVYTGK